MKTLPLHIGLFDIALFASIVAGLGFSVRLWFKKPAGDTNRLLSIILAMMALSLIRMVCIDIQLGYYFPRWDWVPLQFLLATGPLLFFYLRSIARPQQKFARKDLLHFSPLLLEMGMHVLAVIQSTATGGDVYQMPVYKQWQPLLHLLAFISVGAYLHRCARLFQYQAREDRHTTPGKAFVRISPSSKDKLIQKGYWLRREMKAKRYYLDAELSLNSLAKELGISIHELSRIINTGMRKNFNDFVNEFRIQDIARRMKDPKYDRITLLGIAYDCGFNSKTTFNRAFKQFLGQSPAEYKGQLKKERPNHDLTFNLHLQR